MEVPSTTAEFVNADRETDRQTGTTKLMVAVCNFASAPRNGVHYYAQLSYNMTMYHN